MRILITLLYNILYFLEIAILIEVILSWVPIQRNQFTDFIHKVTWPILKPAKEIQDRFITNSYLDFSPIIAFAMIRIIKAILRFL
ncbi:YggT family protein [Hathewaya histolytica]|uniref:YggT family protein n=1 Tax=Hathewaya histolytica TaxID=1498 RepID=UPI003B6735BD